MKFDETRRMIPGSLHFIMKARNYLPGILLSVTPLMAGEEGKTIRTARATDAKTDIKVACAAIQLPENTQWRLEPLSGDAPVRQVVLAGPAKQSHRGFFSSQDTKKGSPPWDDNYTVYGVVSGEPKPVELKFTSIVPGRTCIVKWNPADGGNENDPVANWAAGRAQQWQETGLPPAGSITARWLESAPAIYGAGRGADRSNFFRRETVESMDTFAVFGGRCAVTETLQMNDIGARGGPRGDRPAGPVPLAALPKLAVKSHPFAEMAKGVSLPTMPLASLCPADRFFAFFPQPKRIRTVIEKLGSISDTLSSPAVDGAADYRLWQKYLARLGLDEKVVQAWMEAGHAERVAFFLPDLFIRDATDITFLIQMKADGGPGLFKVLPETDAVLTLPGNGGQCHLAKRGSVLIVSTSAAEAALAVKLADSGGKGSLGESDELRCMRHKLPDSAATVAWFYFSDPFIRRLTGPEVKIGQHRRLAAREAMESLTAAALLYQLDHGQPSPDKDTLIRKGYAFARKPMANNWDAPQPADEAATQRWLKDVSLQPGPLAVSPVWGSLPDLKPLSAVPVTGASPEEAEQYGSYVKRYQDYWRQYFDPIAIRLDETTPGAWSLGTFILPLVDNSLYAGLKEAVDAARPAVLPRLHPPPVAMLGVALKKDTVQKGGQELTPGLTIGSAGLTGRMAIAFPDADPVLQAGGLAGIQQLGTFFARGRMNDFAAIGLLVAVLTRPLDLFFELENEQTALAVLDSTARANDTSFVKVRSVTREADGRRLYVIDFDGFAQINVEVAVEQGWMHLSNHPWSGTLKVTGTDAMERNSVAIRINPEALQAGNPAALFAAQNARRSAVLSACSELLPWMEAQGLGSAAAQERQLTSLGFSTRLPEGITFIARRPLNVPSLLSDKGEVLAAAREKDDPGILAGIRSVDLRTGFEEDGLRAELRWTVSP